VNLLDREDARDVILFEEESLTIRSFIENNIEGDAMLPGNFGIQHKPDPQTHYQAIPGPLLTLFEGN
jgi:hypothetical protein